MNASKLKQEIKSFCDGGKVNALIVKKKLPHAGQ
jgi:hypothetical protein